MFTTAALNAIAAALTVYAQVSGLLDSIKVDPETGAREVGASFGGVAEQVLEAILAQLDAAHLAGVTVTNFHGVDATVWVNFPGGPFEVASYTVDGHTITVANAAYLPKYAAPTLRDYTPRGRIIDGACVNL